MSKSWKLLDELVKKLEQAPKKGDKLTLSEWYSGVIRKYPANPPEVKSTEEEWKDLSK